MARYALLNDYDPGIDGMVVKECERPHLASGL